MGPSQRCSPLIATSDATIATLWSSHCNFRCDHRNVVVARRNVTVPRRNVAVIECNVVVAQCNVAVIECNAVVVRRTVAVVRSHVATTTKWLFHLRLRPTYQGLYAGLWHPAIFESPNSPCRSLVRGTSGLRHRSRELGGRDARAP